MTWLAVARKDFRDAVQSRALWALVAVFVLMSLLSTYAYTQVPELLGAGDAPTFDGLVLFTVGIVGLFVPLASIVVCYKALAGERELGSIKLLLSLPTNRRHVFAGKVLGRTAVLLFGLTVGVAVGVGVGTALLGAFDPVTALAFLFTTLAFGAVYATIVVGLSATTGSTARATTLAIGFFVVFELFWDAAPVAIVYVVEGFTLPATFPDWVFLVTQLSPSSAYVSALLALVPSLASGGGPNAGSTDAGVQAAQTGADPFYLAPEVGIVVLLGWFTVAVLVGYARFQRADL
jgi:ABC-2 type transport system permease protein